MQNLQSCSCSCLAVPKLRSGPDRGRTSRYLRVLFLSRSRRICTTSGPPPFDGKGASRRHSPSRPPDAKSPAERCSCLAITKADPLRCS